MKPIKYRNFSRRNTVAIELSVLVAAATFNVHTLVFYYVNTREECNDHPMIEWWKTMQSHMEVSRRRPTIADGISNQRY